MFWHVCHLQVQTRPEPKTCHPRQLTPPAKNSIVYNIINIIYKAHHSHSYSSEVKAACLIKHFTLHILIFMITVFWIVTPCSIVGGSNISEEQAGP